MGAPRIFLLNINGQGDIQELKRKRGGKPVELAMLVVWFLVGAMLVGYRIYSKRKGK
ncbi:MAG: hypothetical protein H6Q52_2636 [Deltaproteobacteria bacterium]|nr:hypothetical protein [Deltaproteobacteria bacterium]